MGESVQRRPYGILLDNNPFFFFFFFWFFLNAEGKKVEDKKGKKNWDKEGNH